MGSGEGIILQPKRNGTSAAPSRAAAAPAALACPRQNEIAGDGRNATLGRNRDPTRHHDLKMSLTPTTNARIIRYPAFLLAGCLILLSHAARGQSPTPGKVLSYGELAAQKLCGPLDEIHRGLTNFTTSTLPHEAKDLRKQLGKFRNRLDLFAFAYPTGPGKDPFVKLRDDLDKGYERMGEFKDLFDAQRLDLAVFDAKKQEWSKGIRPAAVTYADAAKVQSRREKVLKWQAKFLEPERLAAYRAYICAPDLQAFHPRPAKDLSRFFWGSEAGLVPRPELSGVDNFRWLAAEMLTRALKDYPAIQELRDLEGETAETFHDFRKRVRAVVKITEDIELLPKENSRAEKLHKLMDDLDDSYGKVNNQIVELALAVEEGNSAKAAKLRAEIASDWTRLRQWQNDHQVTTGMTEFAGLLRSLLPAGQPAR